MLETRNVSVFYGSHHALDGASVTVDKNEIVVMLGANGAGKSTFLRAIAGLTPAAEGSVITMDGIDITGKSPDDIVEAGIATVPEDRGIFADLTARENLLLGAYPERARPHEAENLDRVLSLFPRLGERQNQAVRTMSGGERQMVAIGRAMMSHPSILMLDEPSLGLSPLLCSELFRSLTDVKETGVGIFLVEQNAKQSLAIADRGYLLDNGHVTGAGSAEELSKDQTVINTYLGGTDAKIGKPARPIVAPDEATAEAAAEAAENPYAITAGSRASARTRLEEVLPVSIADLVDQATHIQSEHVRDVRKVHPDAAPAQPVPGSVETGEISKPAPPPNRAAPRHRAAPSASAELQAMLAGMEKAAADAVGGGGPASSEADKYSH
ncbi:MAG: ABC transporter ATP-binding protein [Rhodospirillales bacterium]|jgi:branched-chain amino acid transport system ATP-binding protein|nr:ABC transporter ATP-binding protein [Rhodospirillaceae bacterium]MDP6426928.1 ABC transporter ATP-binding protein [Rhodospirillales bacterium]MDP6645370.1 ABC transporter ATP-binding protein [Rhodospirillales bacterium]MDP6842606.1 ABC transporter ATP-binding protein [Rhodospirillales bacterium]